MTVDLRPMKTFMLSTIYLIAFGALLAVQSAVASEVISRDPSKIDRGLQNREPRHMKRGVFNEHTYQIIKDPTGSAPSALVERFEARFDDCDPDRRHGKSMTTDCNSGRTRTEVEVQVLKLKSQWSKSEPKEYWYGWSIYFPEDYISQNKYTIPYLGQFWQGDRGESGQSPTVNFTESGESYRANGSPVDSDNELRGKWHKVEMHIRWSTLPDGFVRVYGNGRLVYELENAVTANRARMFFKYGIYRTKDNSTAYPPDFKYPTQVVYYSNVKIAKTREKLAP